MLIINLYNKNNYKHICTTGYDGSTRKFIDTIRKTYPVYVVSYDGEMHYLIFNKYNITFLLTAKYTDIYFNSKNDEQLIEYLEEYIGDKNVSG